VSFAPEPIDRSEPETTQARKAGEGAFWYALRNAGWTDEQTFNSLNTYRGMIAAELAEKIRAEYLACGRVSDMDAWDAANLIDPEVAKQ
jgi:hypothetical protein